MLIMTQSGPGSTNGSGSSTPCNAHCNCPKDHNVYPTTPELDLQTNDEPPLLSPEHSQQLQNLVEDKEIAARAVALVVSSTRKGIVPLCADVAHLLRHRRHIENKLRRIRHENEILRSTISGSTRTSISTSPMPNSIHSCDNRPHEYCSLCSRSSSQCSSLVSNSPKLDKNFHQRSPRLHRSSAFSVPLNRDNEAMQHHVHDVLEHQQGQNGITSIGICGSDDNNLTPFSDNGKVKCHRRKGSLPEMVSEPHANVPKVSPRMTSVSKETQCMLDANNSPTIEQQFRESLQINSKLTEDLCQARKEIDRLQMKIKELEMGRLSRSGSRSDNRSDSYHVEDECGQQSPAFSDKARRTDDTSGSDTSSSQSSGAHSRRRKSPSPVLAGPPLSGCKCNDCEKLQIDDNCVKLKKSSSGSKLQLDIGDHVVTKGDKTGYVRYIGHLDELQGTTNMIFVGVELDAPVGTGDGSLHGKQYFKCAPNYGVFLSMTEIVRVLSRKSSSKSNPEGQSVHVKGKLERKKSDRDVFRIDRVERRTSDPRDLHKLERMYDPRDYHKVERRFSERECKREQKERSVPRRVASLRKEHRSEKRFMPLENVNLKLPKNAGSVDDQIV